LKTNNIYIYIYIYKFHQLSPRTGWLSSVFAGNIMYCNISIYRVGRPPQFLLVESHFFKNTTMNSC
jgi:hypothetical protein